MAVAGVLIPNHTCVMRDASWKLAGVTFLSQCPSLSWLHSLALVHSLGAVPPAPGQG